MTVSYVDYIHPEDKATLTPHPRPWHPPARQRPKQVFCTGCGAQINSKAKFCSECGAKAA